MSRAVAASRVPSRDYMRAHPDVATKTASAGVAVVFAAQTGIKLSRASCRLLTYSFAAASTDSALMATAGLPQRKVRTSVPVQIGRCGLQPTSHISSCQVVG